MTDDGASLAAHAVWQTTRHRLRGNTTTLRERIVASMRGETPSPDRLIPWWRANSADATAAVVDMVGVDEATASTFLGAAVHGLLLTEQDLTVTDALRATERALAWHTGRRWGQLEAAVAAPDREDHHT